MSDSLQPHGLQHARLPCPSIAPGACSNSCPSSPWCHPTISSSDVSFSSCLQSCSASGSILLSIQWVSSSHQMAKYWSFSLPLVLLMIIQDWFPLKLTDLISLLSKGLTRVFFNTTLQKHQFFSARLSLCSKSNIHTWLGKPKLSLDGKVTSLLFLICYLGRS